MAKCKDCRHFHGEDFPDVDVIGYCHAELNNVKPPTIKGMPPRKFKVTETDWCPHFAERSKVSALSGA